MADTDVQSNDVDNLKAAGEDGGATDGSPKDNSKETKDTKPRPPPVDIAAAQNAGQDGGIKTPTAQTPKLHPGPSRYDTFRDKEKKIGHRRVGEGGVVTYKKIGTSQLMGSIQLGIQQAVGSLAGKPDLDVLIQDFYVVETIFFASAGSQSTPAHQFSDFRFKVYAPIAFRHFRDLFKIQPEDYLVSLCTEPLRELSNPGASGSIFYLTNDDEFIIKTVQHKEADFLQKLLPGYYMNLNQNPRTLLPKFFGLYNYQCNAKNIRLITMNNLLPSSIKMHQRYDLKGSTYKRKASKYERSKDSPTFKDLDFMEHHPDGILLEAETYKALINTIARDCRVLTSFKIMDYSLLVGIHNLDQAAKKKAQEKERRLNGGDGGTAEDGSGEGAEGSSLTRSRSINRHKLVAHSTAMESIQADSDPIDEEDQVPPGGIPARNAKGERLLLFLGIIDILQSFRLKKKLEHTFKSMIHDGDTISVHRPTFYAQRFLKFMEHTVFKRIPSPLRHSPSRRRGTSLRMLRPMSQTDPEHSAEGHDSQEGSGGRLPGGSVSAEDRPGESGEVAISLSMATGGSGATTTVTSTPSAVAGAASGSVSGAVTAGGGGSAAASALGSGTPSTPINLPAVLQDRPHSGRGRVPPPVPPRSPRGGTTQTTSTSSSFSLARGGVAYLTMPPSPRFAGGSPRFSHLCSPSIGMTGYNIWHADSMCRLDKDCMMPILHAHPYERQHYVWQVPTEDVLALSPMHSGGATPDDTPHKRAFRRTNAGVAIHAMRGIYDVIKTASRPGTPTSTSSTHPSYDEGLSPSHQHSHIHSYRPSCLSRQSSVEQNKCEFVLPDTHITSTGNSPSSHSVINKTSLCLSRTSPKHSFSSCSHTAEQIAAHHSKLNRNLTLGETFSPIPLLSQSRLPDDSLSESVTSINGAISKPPSSQVNNIISKESLQESVARGRKCWGKAQELQLYNNTDMTRLFPGNMKPLSRNSFAGTERLQVEGENLKRNSLVDRPSAEEEAYIEHALTMYLGRSRSPSPFKDHLSHSSYGNSYSPSQFGGSHSQMPYSPSHTPSPVKHQSTGQLGMTSDANLGRKSSLNSELQSSLRHMSSPGLLEDLRRHHSNNADDQPQPSQVMHRTFYTEI